MASASAAGTAASDGVGSAMPSAAAPGEASATAACGSSADGGAVEADSSAEAEADVAYMRRALQEARDAMALGEVPVGCLFVDLATGGVLAVGSNQTNRTRNGTRHCEMIAIDAMLSQHGVDSFSRARLYVTLEPCIMCAAALQQVGVAEVVFGAPNTRFGGCGGVLCVHEFSTDGDAGAAASAAPDATAPTASASASSAPADPPSAGGSTAAAAAPGPHSRDALRRRPLRGFKSRGGVLADEIVVLLRDFYATGNPNAPDEKRHRPLAREEVT